MAETVYQATIEDAKFRALERIARERHLDVSRLIDLAIDELIRRLGGDRPDQTAEKKGSVVRSTFGVYSVSREDVQHAALDEEFSYDV